MLYIKYKNNKNNKFSSNEINAINCFSSIEELYNFTNKIISFSTESAKQEEINKINKVPETPQETQAAKESYEKLTPNSKTDLEYEAERAFVNGNVHDSGEILNREYVQEQEKDKKFKEYLNELVKNPKVFGGPVIEGALTPVIRSKNLKNIKQSK